MDGMQAKVPVLLMVSGGSDSTAMLELVCDYRDMRFDVACSCEGAEERMGLREHPLMRMIACMLPDPGELCLHVLHVNHQLRGRDSDDDEEFVRMLCARRNVPLEVQRVDVAARAQSAKGGMEAIAREVRYQLADAALERACVQASASSGIICTAHTLDDRVETFFMRALVGTGPGGLASIPRVRGKLRRPLLDTTREQLRDWLRKRHPGTPDALLWREDETNLTGDNFRSRVRRELMPVARALRPGFERALSQTMDLIADEHEALQQQAESLVYRMLAWDGDEATLAVEVLREQGRPMARRILRTCLLVVNPDARLEAAQIDRVLDHVDEEGFTTEASGGLRVSVHDDALVIRKAQ